MKILVELRQKLENLKPDDDAEKLIEVLDLIFGQLVYLEARLDSHSHTETRFGG